MKTKDSSTRAPREERNLHWIEPCGGKAGFYVSEITFRGRRIRRFAGWTKEQARATLGKLRNASFEGRLEDVLDPKREELRTFEGYAKDQIESETWKQKRSWKRDELSFGHLKDYFKTRGARALSEITPALVQGYINKRRNEDKAAPATVNRETAFLRSILFLAVEDELIEKNPIRHSKRSARKLILKEDNSREDVVLKHLAPAKVRALITAAEPFLQPMLEIYALTGMRKNEVLKMRWEHVDPVSGTIVVPRRTAKSDKARCIPLGPRLSAVFSGLSRTSEYVFTNPASGRPWNTINKAFIRACEAAEVPHGRKTGGIVLHDLRHFAAFQLVKKTDIVTASRILGHADVKMTMRYVHPSEADKRLAMERVSEDLFPARQKDANAETASPSTDSVN